MRPGLHVHPHPTEAEIMTIEIRYCVQ